MKRFPFYKQLDSKDCGPACLRMVCKYYGKMFSQVYMRRLCFTHNTGTSMLSISDAADNLGFSSVGIKTTFSLLKQKNLPCILQWKKEPFQFYNAMKSIHKELPFSYVALKESYYLPNTNRA